jgi:pimeloyl-ACP methyl ester carboxylesterase
MTALQPAPSVGAMTIDVAEHVRANGIDIHYRDLGRGRPLILLHGGLVSGSDAFADTAVSHARYLESLSRRFRVIAPDTRGAGRSGAICCDAGYDTLNPDAPAFGMLRQLLGGAVDRGVDVGVIERAFGQDPEMARLLELMKGELVEFQGPDAWPDYLGSTVARWAHWPGYGYADLAAITAPTLLMTGDRDHFCAVEDAVTAFRHLSAGELAILPAVGHQITPDKIDVMSAFLARHTP